MTHREILPIFIIAIAIVIGTAEYKAMFWGYVTHKRNKWNAVILLLIIAILVYAGNKHWIRADILITAVLLWLVACIAFIVSLKPKSFKDYTVLPLKQLEKCLYEGNAIEHISYFDDKKPWCYFTINDLLEYYMLDCQYYFDLKDYDKAFKALGSIKDSWLYKEEKQTIDLQKAILLALLGDMKAAQCILGDPDKNVSKDPMVWFAYSFIYENAGDIDKAYEMIDKSRSIIASGYKAPDSVIASVYNNYARVLIFKGNKQETIRYLDAAWNNAKNCNDMRTIHTIGTNRIMEMAIAGKSRQECENALKEYRDLIPNDSFMNLVEYNNCAVKLYRQFGDSKKENELIKTGYYDVIDNLKPDQAIMYTVTTFSMLINGHYDYTWLDEHISTSLDDYMKLPLLGRLFVFNEYIGYYYQEEFKALYNTKPYSDLKNMILEYYHDQAIAEIDRALAETESYNMFKYMNLMRYKLGILKLVEGKQHIDNSKNIYLDLYNQLNDAGLIIDALSILMILINECTSPFNLMIRTPNFPSAVYYCDLLDNIPQTVVPVLAPDGIHMTYPRFQLPIPCEVMSLQENVVREHIDTVIDGFKKLKNHPFKVELSIEIMRILLGLERMDEAEELLEYFKESGVSEMHLPSWAREQLAQWELTIERKKLNTDQ